MIEDSPLPRHRRSIPLYAALADLPIDVDTEVVVYTPAEVEEWRGANAAFVTTALREGKVLYEVLIGILFFIHVDVFLNVPPKQPVWALP